MFSSLLILLAMPWVDTSRVRGSQFRPLMRWAFWLFVANFFVLMFIGSQHVEEPFITVGAVSTGFYFAWFLVIVPVIGIVENTLLDIATEPKTSNSISNPLYWDYKRLTVSPKYEIEKVLIRKGMGRSPTREERKERGGATPKGEA